MGRLFSPRARIGWLAALLLIAAMGVVAFTGPYHLVNKPVAAPRYPPVIVRWVTDPAIVARSVPDPVRAHVGQPVTWVNASNAAHTATARNGSFDSGNVQIGASWTYLPRKAGTFPYLCIYHPLMHGILIVVP
jgi:hypothetical protein